MLLEIQRTAVLSIFFYILIQAQDFRKRGVNTGATDPFAKPDVDPFAKPDVDPFGSMMTGGNTKSTNKKKSQITVTRTIVKTERKSGTQRTNNQPVVGSGTVKTSKTATSTVVKNVGGGKARTSNTNRSTSKVTKTIAKGKRVMNKPGLGQQNRVKSRTSTETKTVTRNTNNAAAPVVSVSKASKTVVRKSSSTDGSRSVRKFASGGDRSATRTVTTVVRKSSSTDGSRPVKKVASGGGRSATRTVTTVVRKSSSNDGSRPVRKFASDGGRSATRTVTTTRKSSEGIGQSTKNMAGGRTQETVSIDNVNRNSVDNIRGAGTGGGAGARKTKNTSITRTSVNRGSDGTRTNNRKTSSRGGMSSTNLENVMNFGTVNSKTERITNVAPNSLTGFNTGRIFEMERNNIISTGTNNERVTNIETGREKPVYYIRNLYRDQRICDACNTEGTDCYLRHPEECRKYIRCSATGAGMEALEMNCAFGTFWSELANTCDLAQDAFCEMDKCRNTSIEAYPSGINCRSYWRCVNRRSDAECCPHGQAYRDGVCMPDDACKVDDGECPFRHHQKDKPKSDCTLEKVEGNAGVYRVKGHWAQTPMNCAVGTVFDENKCVCVKGDFTGVRCEPHADLVFTTEKVENKINNHIDDKNIKLGKGYGEFNGRASVAVPYYDKNEIYEKRLVIRIRFWHGGQGYDSQVLASNCRTRSGDELSPSFAILLARNSSQIMFFASTKHSNGRQRYGATATVKLNFVTRKWTVVELRWLDEVLYGRVETLEEDGKSTVSEGKQALKGKLQKSVMPLMIGNCYMNDGFVGFIDQVVTYTCDPGPA